MIRIDWPFRPDYEGKTLITLMLALAALLAVFALFTFTLQWPVLPATVIGFATLLTFMLYDGLRRHAADELRNHLKLTTITRSELAKIARENPDYIYLGEGYLVGTEEARAIYMLSESGLSRNFVSDDRILNHGATWLRVLAKPQPVLLPVHYATGHVGIFGTTRAGKTKCLDIIINQLLARKQTVIVIDPKGDNDLEESVRRAAADAGVAYHYIHLAHPERSARINPIRNGFATELASRISSNIATTTGAGDPFAAVSHMALTQIIGGILAEGRRPTLVLIRKYLERGPEELLRNGIKLWADQVMSKDWVSLAAKRMTSRKHKNADVNDIEFLIDFYLEVISKDHKNEMLDGLISQIRHDRSHFEKMVMSLMPVMNNLTAAELGPLMSPDPDDQNDKRPIINLSDLMARGEVLYVGLSSLSQKDVGSTVGAMLCADAAACASDRYNYAEHKEDIKPVHLLVDESTEVLNDSLISLLNKGGGAQFYNWLCAQTDSDITVRMGSKAKTAMVLGNMNNTIAFRIQDEDTQKMVASKMQDITVVDVLVAQGETQSEGSRGSTTSGNVSRRQSSRQVKLIPHSVMSSMPTFDYLVKMTSGDVFKGRIPLLVNDK